VHGLQHLRTGLPRRLHPCRHQPDAEGRRNIDRYEIDFRICMYCGLCTEACPYEAIQPGGPLDDAVTVFDEMYRDKHALTRMAETFLQTHENTYPNGMKAPDPDADFHRL
jgi:NADH-quinone oxidoreductase subunit I